MAGLAGGRATEGSTIVYVSERHRENQEVFFSYAGSGEQNITNYSK
jgi:hypothetical protein